MNGYIICQEVPVLLSDAMLERHFVFAIKYILN